LHSPYAGSLSLHPDGDTARSHTFGAYFGMPLTAHLQFYFDLEMFKGEGVSGSTGLGGLTNGDVIRSGTATLGKRPYVARRYLRYVVPLGCEAADVPRGMAICRLPIMAIPACSRVTVGAMVARNRLPSPKWIAA
jgi:high affinity Mn2+ porin